MPETIFGASPVEAILLVIAPIVICRVVKRTMGQATDVAMETVMAPIAILIIVAVILFITMIPLVLVVFGIPTLIFIALARIDYLLTRKG